MWWFIAIKFMAYVDLRKFVDFPQMIKVDASAPTSDEHQNRAVTKLRYMDFRDNMSSSRSLGFRIEALKVQTAS